MASKLSCMKVKRGCHSITYTDGFVYVCGGVNYQEKVLRKCEKYCVATDQWQMIAPMHEPRKNAAACALNAKVVYVFGGKTNVNLTNKIEKYSIYSDNWDVINIKLPCPLQLFGVYKVDMDKILIIGGCL